MAVQYLQGFIAGLLISLTGSLPLGNLNVAAMQIALKETLSKAIWFSVGVTLVEVAYLAVTLSIIGTYVISAKVFFYFQLLSVLVLIALAVGSFRAAASSGVRSTPLSARPRRFVLGVLMSAVNPMQVPFWTGWTVYLLSRSLIPNTPMGFALFAMSAGIGTFMALSVFIFAGRRFSGVMEKNGRQVNMAIGLLLALMAVFQIFKIWQS